MTLLALADFASERNGWKCWPSISRLAEMVNVSERQITRYLQALERLGEIVVHRQPGRGRTNIYNLTPLMKKGDATVTLNGQKPDGAVTLNEPEKGDTAVTLNAEKGDSGDEKGDNRVTRTVNNHKDNEPLIPSASPKRGRSERQLKLSALENFFAEVTGLPVPERKTERQRKAAAVRWWQPLGEILNLKDGDLEKAKALIKSAVAKMRADRLTVAAPQSVLKVALSIHALEASEAEAQPAPPGWHF